MRLNIGRCNRHNGKPTQPKRKPAQSRERGTLPLRKYCFRFLAEKQAACKVNH